MKDGLGIKNRFVVVGLKKADNYLKVLEICPSHDDLREAESEQKWLSSDLETSAIIDTSEGVFNNIIGNNPEILKKALTHRGVCLNL